MEGETRAAQTPVHLLKDLRTNGQDLVTPHGGERCDESQVSSCTAARLTKA